MKQLFFLASIISLLFTACSNNDNTSPDSGKAKLSVRLTGQNTAGVSTRSEGAPTQLEENKITSFKVYIFYNNRLEQSATSATGAELLIEDLTTGSKKVVVIANAATYPNLSEGDPYDNLALPANNIDLGEQQTLDDGLVMTGEINTVLQSESLGTNERTIPVTRIVAKLKLGTITVEPAIGTDIAKFVLSGVAVIKGRGKSSFGIPSVITTVPLYSGITGLEVQGVNVKSYLYENITIAEHTNRYFYVFENNSTNDDESTLLTLEATYNGELMYFPFRVKDIRHNTEYTINVTLRRIGSGSPDPEIPSDPATLTVTIVPQDWVVAPVQNVEW
ncbi:MAG: hypothetical protein RL662_77 [Bacteroidota bacterium]|jgi:hypothetical protein